MSVPVLRFQEFTYTNEIVKFDDLFIFSSGKNIKQNEASPNFKYPCVRYGELYHMYQEVIIDVINRTNLNPAELKFSDGDEILLPSAGEDPLDIGCASALTIKNIAIGRTINILKPKKKGVYSEKFVSYYINEKLKKRIAQLARGASISNVYNSDLKSLYINLPSYKEQQKIASFLGALDKRIELLTKKKDLLEEYKKGVMQKLFSQEIRFKPDLSEVEGNENGNGYPDWGERKLGEVCDVKVGGTPSTKRKDFWDGEIGWIGSGEIKNKHITKPTKTITDLGLKGSSTYLMPENTVVLAMTGATLGKIGMLDFECCGNQSVAGFIPNNTHISLFLFYLLQNELNQIKSFAGGAAQTGINKKNIEGLKLKLPETKEQQKIANFLDTIDKKIEQITQQLEGTKTFKKGLLQKMFV